MFKKKHEMLVRRCVRHCLLNTFHDLYHVFYSYHRTTFQTLKRRIDILSAGTSNK